MPPQKACIHLVDLAKRRGGFDNITVTVVPLDGHLKKEPPPGYQPKMHVPKASTLSNRKVSGVSILARFGIVAILSVVAALLTALALAFQFLE